ncbi:hypothetical protein BLA60_34015 [Actinophytocola xinjiangensis]|uniref:NfeD-like partner-binding protein n=1 Tax=Actinophytocola xinjiangensis TaxID=485602 RepID=A0A7Z1AUN1_9PSEU|nr:hypothetical protein [Actinophytocola xinjiangensis]OLF05808.1 hypothetical protein BLA60_34015 [Actinophytocola xinjiangensis]
MGDFFDAALSFPALPLTFLLAFVVLYWLLVLLGTFDVELFAGDGSFGDGLGLGGVPVTVTASVLIVVGWFATLAGGLIFDGVVAGVGAIVVGLFLGLLAARAVATPLRRLYATGVEPSRNDFVGRECVIRTGRVSADFGQAEVTAADGSSAIVQVRQTGEHQLTSGHRALIFDYDIDGEFFWVAPA